MNGIKDKSVDMILADLPYGTTACSWDSIIDLDKLWLQYERIIKDKGAIVLTASQPFTTKLINSNISLFKYCWYWNKKIPSGMNYCKSQPMRQIEEVVVFGKNKTKYNAQMIKRDKPIKGGGMSNSGSAATKGYKALKKNYDYKYPINLIKYQKIRQKSNHPTEKPVKLFEYLIKTYTNEGDLILDNVAGSGTTGVAAKNTNRNFILMEQEEEYIEIIKERLASLDE
jgi:site-specific DNA-methyltransferase (adenine-specific)